MVSQDKKLQNADQIQVTQENISASHKTQDLTQTSISETQQKLTQDTTQITALQTQQEQMQTQSVTQTTQKSGEQAELKQVWQRIEGNMPPAYKKTITKADAGKAGESMIKLNKEFEGFMWQNSKKYLTKDKQYDSSRAFKGFLVQKAGVLSAPEFTDAELKKQPELHIYNKDAITTDFKEISETEKRLALYNSDTESEKLPLRKKAGFRVRMQSYRNVRIKQEKAFNKVRVFRSVVTEARELMDNKDLKKDQQIAALDMAGYADKMTEEGFAELGDNKLSEDEKDLQKSISEFAEWRVENDVLLTAGDRRWKEYRKFSEKYDDQNDNHRLIRVTFDKEIREISVIDGAYLGEGEISLNATSAQEFEKMCDDIQKMNSHYKDSVAAAAYFESVKETEKEIKGTFKLEFDAMIRLHKNSAANLLSKYTHPDDPEVITRTIKERLKEFEQASDYKGAADYMVECAIKGYSDNTYNLAIREYIEDLQGEIMAMKKLNDEVPPEEDFLLAVADKVCVIEKKARLDAGREMAVYEEKIQKGEIEGCELLSKKETIYTAHDIVQNGETAMRFAMASSVFKLIIQNNKMSYGTKKDPLTIMNIFYTHGQAAINEVIKEEMTKDPTLTEKIAREYIGRAPDENSSLKGGFKLKSNWNGTGSPFENVPALFDEIKKTETAQLYEKKNELAENVKKAREYESKVGETIASYKLFFSQLKSLGIDLRTAPPEYISLYRAFDNVQNMGAGYKIKHGSNWFIAGGIAKNRTDAALAEIKTATETFLNSHAKFSGKDKKKYNDILDIASSTLRYTEGEQARYVDIHKDFTELVSSVLDENQKEIEVINRELIFRGEKGIELSKGVKPRFEGKLDMNINDLRMSSLNLMELISNMKTSNSKVIGGSGEFDKALEGAFTLLDISNSVGEALVSGNPEETLKKTEGTAAAFQKVANNINAYLARKAKQGKTEKKGDEKSKERIKYVKQLSSILETVQERVESGRNSSLRKKDASLSAVSAESILKTQNEINERWARVAAGKQGEKQPQVELDPVAQKYQVYLEEFNNDHFDDIQELKDELALIREKEAEYDDAIRDLRSNWAPESKLKELRTKKYREISKLKDAYKAKVKSKNLYDFGQSVNYDTLDPASYTEELKEHYSKVLKDRGCRVGRSRAANVEFRGKYFMNDPVALDYVWRPGVEQEIKDAYEWLVQYYTVHDTTREKSNEVKQRPVKRKIPKYKIDLSDIDQIVREYEKQPAGTNNCFACAGAEMYRQFCRKEGRLSKPVTQFDIRKYRPRFKTFDEYKKEVEELEPSIDREVYNRYYKETNSYIVGGSVGNIYELGDFFISKQKDAALKKTTLHVPALTKEMTEEQKKDRNVVYNNTKAAFLDKVFEGLSGGHIVTVLTSHPMRHYRTIVGINGEKIKYVDSLGSAHGALQTANVGDLFLPGDGEALNVELVWMEKARNEELKAEYKTLEMNKDGKMYNSDPGIEDIAMLAQTKGVSVSKKLEEQKNDGVHMRECVYLSKSI